MLIVFIKRHIVSPTYVHRFVVPNKQVWLDLVGLGFLKVQKVPDYS